MDRKYAVLALAGSLSLALADTGFAFRGHGHGHGPRVPEFDGASSIAAISVLLGVGAVLFNRSRKK